MVGDLCAVILQAACLTLEDTTVISVFLSMCYFIYFKCNPIASYLCVILSTNHGYFSPYAKLCPLFKVLIRLLNCSHTFSADSNS